MFLLVIAIATLVMAFLGSAGEPIGQRLFILGLGLVMWLLIFGVSALSGRNRVRRTKYAERLRRDVDRLLADEKRHLP